MNCNLIKIAITNLTALCVTKTIKSQALPDTGKIEEDQFPIAHSWRGKLIYNSAQASIQAVKQWHKTLTVNGSRLTSSRPIIRRLYHSAGEEQNIVHLDEHRGQSEAVCSGSSQLAFCAPLLTKCYRRHRR